MERLETDPLTVDVSTEEFRQPTFTVNSQDLIRTLYWMLDSETDAVHLPAIIDAIRRREVRTVRSVLEDIYGGLGSGFSEGMGTSVMCYDAATPTLHGWTVKMYGVHLPHAPVDWTSFDHALDLAAAALPAPEPDLGRPGLDIFIAHPG